MLKNHFVVAIRNLKRFKGFSFINIAGLAVGITCSITLFLSVLDDLSYDKFNKLSDQTYRLFVNVSINGKESINSKTATPLGPTLAMQYPEVVTYARIGYFGSRRFTYQDKDFRVGKIYAADSTFFDVFTLPFLEGNQRTALTRPNTLVVTESAARKYFGTESPVGKVLHSEDGRDLLITGVMKNFPTNSHFSCEFLESLTSYTESQSQRWLDLRVATYIVLRKDCNAQAFEKKLENIVLEYVGPQAEVLLGVPASQLFAQGTRYNIHLQPLTSIYLRSQREYGIDLNTEWADVKSSDIAYTYIFLAVGIFILLLAVINFVNLTTARSERRSKEVGIRKTLGATRPLLIRQFIIEALLMSSIAVFIAVGMVQMLLPYFNTLSGKVLELRLLAGFYTIPALVCFTAFVGILAGSYPAFYLSSFQPMQVLKSISTKGSRRSTLRSILVIFQFAISISFVIGTIVVRSQLDYIQNKNLGFNKEQLLVINNTRFLGSTIDAFKQELSRNPNVVSLSNSTRMFQTGIPGSAFLVNKKVGTDPIMFQYVECDYDFLTTYQVAMSSGRFITRGFSTDTSAIVINEAALKLFGGMDPIGIELTKIGFKDEVRTYTVIGVVRNFHYESLHQQIRPLVLYLGRENSGANVIAVRVQTGDLQKTINYCEQTWKSFVANERFNYSFVDQNLARLYQSEQKTSIIATVFSCLAIFIACLGLFGLAAFVTEQRTKEIGIRKILGASVLEIVSVLSTRFTIWVLAANIVAWPITFVVMSSWLQNFAYRTDLSIWIFLVAGAIAIVIALLTVSYQTVKAAIANPVQSLRYE
jgi:putative ABC transport system permease protein